ncbi:unnamed protein product, partial [Staurois parvus]
MNAAARLIHLYNQSVTAAPLCQSFHWPPLSVLHPPLPIPPLASTQCPHPLCHSLHWLPLSIFHPSLPILHWPPFSVLQPPLPILHSST